MAEYHIPGTEGEATLERAVSVGNPPVCTAGQKSPPGAAPVWWCSPAPL